MIYFAKAIVNKKSIILIQSELPFTSDFIKKISNKNIGLGADEVLIMPDNKHITIYDSLGNKIPFSFDGLIAFGAWMQEEVSEFFTDLGRTITYQSKEVAQDIGYIREVKCCAPERFALVNQNAQLTITLSNTYTVHKKNDALLLQDDKYAYYLFKQNDKNHIFAYKNYFIKTIAGLSHVAGKIADLMNMRTRKWPENWPNLLRHKYNNSINKEVAFAAALALDHFGESNFDIILPTRQKIRHKKIDGKLAQIDLATIIASGYMQFHSTTEAQL
jgi:hypothetical protein